MTITAIILSHYWKRGKNLGRMIEDLLDGSVVPDEIVVFIDSPSIIFEDDRVTIVRTDKSFLPKIRFALGSYFDTDYCFFIDDDLTVRKRTLENFMLHAEESPGAILGLEGSILGDTQTPYANDTSVNRGGWFVEVDVIIRTYFVPAEAITAGLKIQAMNKDFPRTSLDDVYLCLGHKYLNKGKVYVIPARDEFDVFEISDGGKGQSLSGTHYENRNIVCRKLMDKYENG